MASIDLKVSTRQVVNLARQLPREIKLQLIKEWLKEFKTEPSELAVEGFDEPFNLDEFKLDPAQLAPLQKLFEDEPPAEELVELLTK
ncbi:MAG: hypothetical protein J5I98_12355 [Phaeodactylibacter sp.]|nr:hypothetical protein [Phaeodactylibacter sp.]